MPAPSYPAATLPWQADILQQHLQAVWPGVQVHTAAEVDSTSTRLLARAREPGGTTPCLLVAEAQTQGRGRNGRAWQSAPGASLTFSVAVPLAPADWSGMSLAVGVALAQALEPLGASTPLAPRLQLKWPNDLWLQDPGPGVGLGSPGSVAAAPGQAVQTGQTAGWRKLGGILIETVSVGAQRLAVVGVGLNVSARPLPPAGEAQALSSGYACLQELDARFTAPLALACVAPALLGALQGFEREGLSPWLEGFAQRDLLRGQEVSTTSADAPQGVAQGVDARGQLRLRRGGVLHAVSSGEVSVRPTTRPAPQTEGTS